MPSTSNYGTMLGNQNNANFYVDGDVLGSHLNELDDAASSRSSFADIWDSTSIEVSSFARRAWWNRKHVIRFRQLFEGELHVLVHVYKQV